MAVTVGEIYTGVVTGITKFGAFVKLEDGTTGLVHISEVADFYVKEITDVLSDGAEVKVKVLTVADDGKVAMSIKKAQPKPQRDNRQGRSYDRGDRNNDRGSDRNGDKSYDRGSDRSSDRGYNREDRYDRGYDRYDDRSERVATDRSADRDERFENKLAEFMKNSNEKLIQLKRHQEGRRR